MKDKQMFMEEFNNKLHRLGRITLVLSVVFLISLPFVFGAFFGVAPDMGAFLSGFAPRCRALAALAHLRGAQCFLPRTRRGKKQI